MGKSVDTVTGITFEEYAARLEPYTFEYTSKLSGVPVEDLRELAAVFAEPDTARHEPVDMGVNQHNRGTWMNHNIYNIHLLSGKIAQPGNGPFSLTGQPTACGTAREVGTFSHRLPADLLVANRSTAATPRPSGICPKATWMTSRSPASTRSRSSASFPRATSTSCGRPTTTGPSRCPT